MSSVEFFDFMGDKVRVVLVDNEPWFVAADVCKVLGIGNVTDATRRLNSSDVRTFDGIEGLRRDSRLVNEPGLYDLTLDSRKPRAKEFRRWVTAEVLPTIRKTGKYDRFDVENDTELLRGAEFFLNELTKKVRELEEEKAELAPKAEAYEAFLDVDETLGVRDVARALKLYGRGIKESDLTRYLRDIKWMAKHGTAALVPAVEKGFMVNRRITVNNGAKTVNQGRITKKGFEELVSRIEKLKEMV